MEPLPEWAPADTDLKTPSAARMYDYYLGGAHNFGVDRELARKVVELYPDAPALAQANRAFLHRAVRYLVAQGVRQFVDIGSGIPTEGNTHETAQQAAPDSRVLYVDHDPVAVAHSERLLGDVPGTAVLRGDLRRPKGILESRELADLIDLSQPVGLILMNVLGHLPDLDEAVSIVRELMDALPAGSYLVTADGTNVIDGPAFEEAIAIWNANAPLSYHLRRPDQLEVFLSGLELVPPGLVPCARWRPSPDDEIVREVDEFGAVARKSSERDLG